MESTVEEPRSPRAYDAAGFVAALGERNATPRVAQNASNRRSAIDGRTTRHPGCAISGCRRKRILSHLCVGGLGGVLSGARIILLL